MLQPFLSRLPPPINRQTDNVQNIWRRKRIKACIVSFHMYLIQFLFSPTAFDGVCVLCVCVYLCAFW